MSPTPPHSRARSRSRSPLALQLLVVLGAALRAATGVSQVWQTSRAGDRLRALGAVVWSDAPPAGAATILQADFATAQQTIVGFGGAITESAAFNFAQLTPANKLAAAAALFGAPDAGGNGLGMARVAINSPDFALSDYSYANVTGDYALSSFDHTLARDALYVVPMIKAALAARAAARGAAAAAASPLKLFATPWSPPAWMKVPFGGDVPRMDGSTLPGLEGACNASWALYFSYWFSAMRDAHNISFFAYTAQNEPTAINATGVQWDACGFTAQGMVEFLTRFLGPVMQRDHPEVRLMIFDHNNDHVEEWANASYSDPYVASIAYGTAIHWLVAPASPPPPPPPFAFLTPTPAPPQVLWHARRAEPLAQRLAGPAHSPHRGLPRHHGGPAGLEPRGVLRAADARLSADLCRVIQ